MVRRAAMTLILAMLCSCAWGEDVSIHCMAVGGKILEVEENRQLTFKADGTVASASISPDGKTVAYFLDKDDTTSLCIVRSSGGKATRVLSGPTEPDFPDAEQRERKGELWSLDGGSVVWSPDGKLMAFQAERYSWDRDKETTANCILLLAANGAWVRTIDLTETTGDLVFSPDSNRIASTRVLVGPAQDNAPAQEDTPDGSESTLTILGKPIADSQISTRLLVFDLAGGTSHEVALEQGFVQLRRWTDGGQALLYSFMNKGEHGSKKAWLDGRPAETIKDLDFITETSPDGRFTAANSDDGSTTIKDSQTGKAIRTLKDESVYVQCWTPDSSLLLYSQALTAKDASGERSNDLNSLWVTSTQPGKLGTMCVSPEFDDDTVVSCSRDGHRIAYISGSRLYVAELTLRSPHADETKAAGLPLSEENIKELVEANAENIGIAVLSLAIGEGFAPAGPMEEALKKQLDAFEAADALYFPGTQKSIFTYRDPGVTRWSDIEDPGETVVGELDAGYGWKVLIFADSHTETVSKQ